MGTVELNTMAKNLGHVTIYFSQMPMYEVYAIHNFLVAEVQVIEGALIKQFRASNNTIHKMKKTVKETK